MYTLFLQIFGMNGQRFILRKLGYATVVGLHYFKRFSNTISSHLLTFAPMEILLKIKVVCT